MAKPKRRPLFAELLETRDCPSQTITLDALVLPDHYVQLSGAVTGDDPAGIAVNIYGAASATTTTDANGNFSITTNSASLGIVYAFGMDQEQNPITNTASDDIEFAGNRCDQGDGGGFYLLEGTMAIDNCQATLNYSFALTPNRRRNGGFRNSGTTFTFNVGAAWEAQDAITGPP